MLHIPDSAELEFVFYTIPESQLNPLKQDIGLRVLHLLFCLHIQLNPNQSR